METQQVLKITVSALNVWGSSQTFYAKMGKDGRIAIPKLMLDLLKRDKPNLEGYVIEVTLEPT